MVYRGKPSAGCENCRKAKKRCGLERPSCSRCIKLKKLCSGYRDTTELQIADESDLVRQRANRRRVQLSSLAPGIANATSSPDSDYSGCNEKRAATSYHDASRRIGLPNASVISDSESSERDQLEDEVVVCATILPRTEDIATAFFYAQFTSINGHWGMLRNLGLAAKLNPMLRCAIQACGMAALNNIRCVVGGRELSSVYYAEALGVLNTALRDPEKCKTDESLIAVALLGYFENLTCDSRQSVRSWKTHITGATQLLKLRGRRQLRRPLARMLFRELRSQILITCVWDDREPPAFLMDWTNDELIDTEPTEMFDILPADTLSASFNDLATLQSRVCYKRVSDADALQMAAELEVRMSDWAVATTQREHWRYHSIEVDESPHVWNGLVHAYVGHPAPSIWNLYRNLRIMLTRTQELLCKRCQLDAREEATQMAYFRSVRRQMADEICAGLPCQLMHAAPAWNTSCPLLGAYASIWPLFFAGTCVLERIGAKAWCSTVSSTGLSALQSTSSAVAQAAWVIGRLEYISRNLGLRWADGVMAVLKGDFAVHENILPDLDDLMPWTEKVKNSGRGVKILLEEESPLSDALNRPRAQFGPIWLGRESRDHEKYGGIVC